MSAEPTEGLVYLYGFGNEFLSEAVEGAVPRRQNSPQRTPFGLYHEQHTASSFTESRAATRRSWVYRLRPSAAHPAFRLLGGPLDSAWRSAPLLATDPDAVIDPNRLRWSPVAVPASGTDFVDGLRTLGASGDVTAHEGMAWHVYAAAADMTERVLVDADGELLVVPQHGALLLLTEFGRLHVAPGEIAVIGRAVRFRVELPEGSARGYVVENHGAPFTLPELGPIGLNGLAEPRHVAVPTAWFEDRPGPIEVVQRYGGRLWSATYDHSPLDVVGWHGNHGAFKYDLDTFVALGSVTVDHPDPSVFTVLTSPSALPGVANIDVAVIPPRWSVFDGYRPPYFHRNAHAEFMGLIRGSYDAKTDGFVPGGTSLHNAWSAHGPDRTSHDAAVEAPVGPVHIGSGLAILVESRLQVAVPGSARGSDLHDDYDAVWAGFARAAVPGLAPTTASRERR